jgi:hypothetical protein
MHELDMTKSREAMHSINAITFFGEYAIPLKNRPCIYAVKAVLHDTWAAIGFPEEYATQIGVVNNELAFLLSDIAIAMSTEFEQRTNDRFQADFDRKYKRVMTEQLRCTSIVEVTDNRIKRMSKETENRYETIDTRIKQLGIEYRATREQSNKQSVIQENMLASLNRTAQRVDDLYTKQKRWNWRSDMSTLPALLTQLENTYE